MTNHPTVLIHGTGFAGQGHLEAFREAGAQVIGIVGRTASVVEEIARQKSVEYTSLDWQQALIDCQPDIVSIGTPGGAHAEPIKQALSQNCHVFCDKPLTTNATTAITLYEMARRREVKTAFAASFRYMPHVMHAKQLVAAGAIGEPLEVECISHFNLAREIPFGWSHRKEEGGGRLNNNFTHKLSIVTSILGEKVIAVMGDLRDDLEKAPIVEGVHNFKTRRNYIPDNLDDPSLEWGESNVEWSYTVLARIESHFATNPVSVLFKHAGLHPRFDNDHISIYGSHGAIYIRGHYGSGPLFFYGKDKRWKALSLPAEISQKIPQIENDTERNWSYLIRNFVKDIRGESSEPYQTFKEGCQYQQLIEVIRENDNWVDVSHIY